MAEYYVRIDAPQVMAEGSVYPRFDKLEYKVTKQDAERYVTEKLLPHNAGSKVTLFESVSEFLPATHVRKPVEDNE